MIIYIIDNDFVTKSILPVKISGVYQIHGKDNTFLGNIEEENNSWIFKPTTNIIVEYQSNLSIVNYVSLIVKDTINNEKYYLYAIPTYDENMYKYIVGKDTLVIGNDFSNDIYYKKENLPNGNITLTYNNYYWTMETTYPDVILVDKVVSKAYLFNGDYLFFEGLKIIFYGKNILINNPNGLVTINKSLTLVNEDNTKESSVIESNIPDDTPLYTKDDYFFKSPRFDSVIEEETVKIDEPPAPESMDQTPLITTIGPQLTMIVTSGISIAATINNFSKQGSGEDNTISLIFSISTMLVTAVGAFLWPGIARNINKKNYLRKETKRRQRYSSYLDKKKQEISYIKQKQKQIIIENAITVDKLTQAIDQRNRILWQRNIEHEDFLQIRLGIGNVSAKIKVDIPEDKFTIEDTDRLYQDLQKVVLDAQTIEKVPQTITLTEDYITAVVGQDPLLKSFLDNVFLQIMTLHSYSELKIIVYTESANKWDYLKIIPHCWDNSKQTRYFATNIEELTEITLELDKSFDSRVAQEENEKNEDDGSEELDKEIYKEYKPYYLIFTDEISNIRNVPLIKKILKYKKNVGFSLLIANDRLSTLPSETTSFIIIDQIECGLIKNELSKDNQKKFVGDYLTNIDIYAYAKKIANIPIVVEKSKYELPNSLSFLEMYGVGKVEQLNINERWANNNPTNTLSVPVGIDQNGELFKMDIHEKQYGPHGLIAGTTGSGKSEWIITYILSLAVNYHPDELQFVLIDYKGGGLALSFENEQLGIKLPHLAGTITNLDKSAINRSIASIESELKRRQSVFNEAREDLKEGSMNIYKYQELYRKGMVKEPMSHLLIICDEFAELKSQQPEFMDQLISISRIGRSLGVHLILATQKPSGVVNDQIWSNSKFKVCLKVQSVSDSNEVLKKPDAAYLKQVGAFYLEVGTDEYYNLGQSAWAGAKYYPSDVLQKKIDQSVEYISNIGKVISSFDDDKIRTTKKECKGEELINIIQYIDTASKKEKLIKRQLWLPNVKPVTYLKDLITKYNHQITPYKYNIAIGEYDEPRRQEQGLLELELIKGNVCIIGQVGSGKEMLLTTIIWSSISEHTPAEINYYIIDMAAETLKKFSKFPHVGEVVTQGEPDKIIGVLNLILEEQDKRKEEFTDYNGSFEYYNKVNEKKKPLIVVVINGIEIFEETMAKFYEALNSMYRDGPRYGIIYIVSTSNQNGLRQRQLQFFNNVIVMQLQDDSFYRGITNCRRGLFPGNYIGRGICKIGEDADSYCEFQTTNIIEEDKQIEYLNTMAAKMISYYKTKAKQLAKVPDNITSEELTQYITNLENVPIGYNFYEKTIAKYNFLDEKIYLVTGKDMKENINAIYGLVGVLSKIPNVKVRVIDMLEIFKKPILDIKLFQDNIDVVFAAVEKDVLTRTELQDNAINIIIGIGKYKKVLSPGGIEIFQNLFNNIIKSKKETFILVDDYDRIKSLKLEPWYNIINNNKGIWLGKGLSNQSIFATNELTQEDKKYSFNCLSYTITDAKYTVIKTVMDGDE